MHVLFACFVLWIAREKTVMNSHYTIKETHPPAASQIQKIVFYRRFRSPESHSTSTPTTRAVSEENVEFYASWGFSWTGPNYFSSKWKHSFTAYFALRYYFTASPTPSATPPPPPPHTHTQPLTFAFREWKEVGWLIVFVYLWTILCRLVFNVKLCICGPV